MNPAQMKRAVPIQFAIAELNRYLRCSGAPEQLRAGTEAEDPLRVGLIQDLQPDAPVPDHPMDDAILIDVKAGSGIIAGANPRSCLLAVYRLLREAGCRFLRPGPDGEIIPQIDWSHCSIHVQEQPDYRHRGVCIEGSVPQDVLLAMIDWLPKNGMNAYFIQFREAHEFLNRYASGAYNPSAACRQDLSAEQAQDLLRPAIAEIVRRGLIYHAVGHGWTCEPFGISGLGWQPVDDATLPAGVHQFFAELNGERKLFGGVPLDTNLCFGHPEVIPRMVSDIVAYAAAHPEVDLLHIWLADGANNHCECARCRDTLPADFYVRLLNAADAQLTEHGLSTRLVFLAYVDLLWAPEQERLINTERFVLMFAPITRTYQRSFAVDMTQPLPLLDPYVRNRLVFPQTPEANLAYLRDWQRKFPGLDSFDFDYHMMWDHYRDAAHERLSRVLWEDLRGLRDLGLNGFVSCQIQRIFAPSPLLMHTLANGLWNRNMAFDPMADALYQDAFGQAGTEVRRLLQAVSDACAGLTDKSLQLKLAAWLGARGKNEPAGEPLASPDHPVVIALGALPKLACQLTELANLQNSSGLNRCQQSFWNALSIWAGYLPHFAAFASSVLQGHIGQALAAADRIGKHLFPEQPALHYTFDSEFLVYMHRAWLTSLRQAAEHDAILGIPV